MIKRITGFLLFFGALTFHWIQGQIWQPNVIRTAGGELGGDDEPRAITKDAAGNFYVTGSFEGWAVFGAKGMKAAGQLDIFLAKYSPTGTLLWVRRAGGVGDDVGYGVAVDGNAVYVTGSFTGTANFNTPSSSGTNELVSMGDQDLFLASFDDSGNLNWLRRGGGIGADVGRGVAALPIGVVVTGSFESTANFNTPFASGSNEIATAGNSDLFVAQWSATGNLSWIKRAGGAGADAGAGLAILGNMIYLTGTFSDTANFNTPSQPGSNELLSAGSTDICLSKMDWSGNLQWLRRMGGTGYDYAGAVAANSTDIFLTGTFHDIADFNTPSNQGVNTIASLSGEDVLVAKFDQGGNYQWGRRAGSINNDDGFGISIYGNNVFVSGTFSVTANFNTPSAVGSNEITTANTYDAFLALYDANGNFQWAKRVGGNDYEFGYAVAATANGATLVSQFFGMMNLNTPSNYALNQMNSTGQSDILISTFNNSGQLQWYRQAGGGHGSSGGELGTRSAIDGLGNLYVYGSFVGVALFEQAELRTDGGSDDMFLAKYDPTGSLIWLRRAGGPTADSPRAMVISGNAIYITGDFQQTVNFQTPSFYGTNEIMSAGSADVFVAKFDLAGNFIWARRAGGTQNDRSSNITTFGDAVYIVGEFVGTMNFNNPYSPGSNEVTSNYLSDAFVAKYDTNGNFLWARRSGGSNSSNLLFGAPDAGIAANASNVYVLGGFDGTSNFNTPYLAGSNELAAVGGADMFLAHYDAQGNFLWAKRAGSTTNSDAVGDLRLTSGGLYFSGSSQSTANFTSPYVPGVNEIQCIGYYDAWVTKYDFSGNCVWVKRAGSSSGDAAFDIAVEDNHVMIAGSFQQTANFNTPFATGSNEITSIGSEDIFVANFDTLGNFQWARRAGGINIDRAYSVALQGAAILLTGHYVGTANFNTPSAFGTNEISSLLGNQDIFLASYNLASASIYVTSNNVGVPNGNAAPSSSNNTQFGNIAYCNNSQTRTFYILNQGATNLTVSSLTSSNPIFTVGGITTPLVLNPGGFVSFTITFSPSGVGPSNSSISISTSDILQNPYSFSVAATAVIASPPVANGQQTFCNGAVIADLSATGSMIQWYATSSGGVALPSSTLLSNATSYYASQTLNGCESATRTQVAVTLITAPAPTGSLVQSFCQGSTVSNLSANGTGIQWYLSPNGGSALLPSDTLTNGTTYYASQTLGSCESQTRLPVAVTITIVLAPNGANTQTFCIGSLVGSLNANGANILWYLVPTGGTALLPTTPLVNGSTYYASQSINGCESQDRLAVLATAIVTPAPTATSPQTHCSPASLNDLIVSGSNITWYASFSGGAALATNTPLVNGATYYASQTVNGCESNQRPPVGVNLIVINNSISQGGNTLSSNQSNAGYQWVDCGNGYLPIPNQNAFFFTPSSTGSYAVILHYLGCSDTSACQNVTVVGLGNGLQTGVRLYPNPSSGKILIEVDQQQIDEVFRIVNAQGQIVHFDRFNAKVTSLDLHTLPAGLYFIRSEGPYSSMVKFEIQR